MSVLPRGGGLCPIVWWGIHLSVFQQFTGLNDLLLLVGALQRRLHGKDA